MDNEDLAWAVEEACLNGWPSPRQVLAGGWLLRAAGGPSRRINSVSPLRAAAYDPGAMLDLAAPVYAAVGQPLIVRVPSLARGLDGPLAARGFEAQHETLTLFMRLEGGADAIDPAVQASAAPTPDWLALRSHLTGGDPETDRVLGRVLDGLLLPTLFVGVRSEGRLVSGALGVIDRGLMVVEAVGTDPAERGRGHARRMMAALLAWARRQNAFGACLQVNAANTPALALYAGLGFRSELYRYTYRCRERLG